MKQELNRSRKFLALHPMTFKAHTSMLLSVFVQNGLCSPTQTLTTLGMETNERKKKSLGDLNHTCNKHYVHISVVVKCETRALNSQWCKLPHRWPYWLTENSHWVFYFSYIWKFASLFQWENDGFFHCRDNHVPQLLLALSVFSSMQRLLNWP